MSECGEVAATMIPPRFETYSHAIAWVRERMVDESDTVISNVAWSLYQNQRS